MTKSHTYLVQIRDCRGESLDFPLFDNFVVRVNRPPLSASAFYYYVTEQEAISHWPEAQRVSNQRGE
jgi:hypothetical protein